MDASPQLNGSWAYYFRERVGDVEVSVTELRDPNVPLLERGPTLTVEIVGEEAQLTPADAITLATVLFRAAWSLIHVREVLMRADEKRNE